MNEAETREHIQRVGIVFYERAPVKQKETES